MKFFVWLFLTLLEQRVFEHWITLTVDSYSCVAGYVSPVTDAVSCRIRNEWVNLESEKYNVSFFLLNK